MGHRFISMGVSIMLAALCLLASAIGASAASVLEKISRSGKFTAGTRTSSIPFAYINEKNEWVGFSVDLIKEIHRRLNRNAVALGYEWAKEISLQLKKATPRDRIYLVVDGTIDIECGSTTYTRSRDEVVDFSINIFYTGSQLLVKKRSLISSLKDLAGKRVGVAEGTTTERKIRAKQPEAEIVVFPDHSEGFLALQQGKIDAYSTDGILLAGLVAKSPNPDDFGLVDFFSSEPYSCILPQNDSAWRDFVNHTFMELIESGKYFQLYDKWFGEKGVVHYPMLPWVKVYLTRQVMPRY